MDWWAWLSKSGLEPSLVHEYAILFFDNELEEDDIAHLDHAFLQSMGVSVAKHRLEILKLAGNEGGRTRWRKRSIPSPLAAAIKNCLARYVAALSCSRGVPAAVLAPLGAASPGGDCRWGGVVSRRKAKLALLRQGRLVITERGVGVVAHMSPPRSHSASASASPIPSPMVARCCRENGGGGYSETGGDGGLRWETMFRNLKPT